MKNEVELCGALLRLAEPMRAMLAMHQVSPNVTILYGKVMELMGVCRQIRADRMDVRDMAVKLCAAAGDDPFEHIKGGAAVEWEDYGERWQAYRRAEGQIMGPDWQLLAEIALGKKQ